MASILNTDLGDLYDQWNQRVAFNEGYRAQAIAESKQAGRDAFSLGLDRVQGRNIYNETKDQRFQEAREFFAPEPAAQVEDASDLSPEVVEPDDIGEVTDGEETLGMETCVANETEDVKTGWETIRDEDGNFLRVVNHDARWLTSDEILEDVFDDLALEEEMTFYRDSEFA